MRHRSTPLATTPGAAAMLAAAAWGTAVSPPPTTPTPRPEILVPPALAGLFTLGRVLASRRAPAVQPLPAAPQQDRMAGTSGHRGHGQERLVSAAFVSCSGHVVWGTTRKDDYAYHLRAGAAPVSPADTTLSAAPLPRPSRYVPKRHAPRLLIAAGGALQGIPYMADGWIGCGRDSVDHAYDVTPLAAVGAVIVGEACRAVVTGSERTPHTVVPLRKTVSTY